MIREAMGGDSPAIAALRALLDHRASPSAVRDRLGKTSEPTLVAIEDGEVIGLCGLASAIYIHRDKPVGRITILVVADEARGRGIGARLVAEAERYLALIGCGMVEVTSNFRLEQAHDFYESRGYRRSSFRFYRKL